MSMFFAFPLLFSSLFSFSSRWLSFSSRHCQDYYSRQIQQWSARPARCADHWPFGDNGPIPVFQSSLEQRRPPNICRTNFCSNSGTSVNQKFCWSRYFPWQMTDNNTSVIYNLNRKNVENIIFLQINNGESHLQWASITSRYTWKPRAAALNSNTRDIFSLQNARYQPEWPQQNPCIQRRKRKITLLLPFFNISTIKGIIFNNIPFFALFVRMFDSLLFSLWEFYFRQISRKTRLLLFWEGQSKDVNMSIRNCVEADVLEVSENATLEIATTVELRNEAIPTTASIVSDRKSWFWNSDAVCWRGAFE